jgi:DNA-binding NtrC family response regulator
MEDIPLLIESFCLRNKNIKSIEVAPGALKLLENYSWPWNIRKLRAAPENAATRLTVSVIRNKYLCAVFQEINIQFSRLGVICGSFGSYGLALLSEERRHFDDALQSANSSREKAAKILEISRATYFQRAIELGLVKPGVFQTRSASITTP